MSRRSTSRGSNADGFARLIAVAGLVVAGLSFFHQYRSDQIASELESDRALHRAWDLLGGVEGTGWLFELPSDPRTVELARREVNEALRLTPDRPKAWRYLGLCREAVGDADGAADAFGRAVESDRSYAPAVSDLARNRLSRGTPEEALQTLRDAPRTIAGDPRILHSFGTVHLSRYAYGEAEAVWRKALDRAPRQPVLLNDLGAVLCVRKELVEAKVHLRQAVRHAPRWGTPLRNLGIALYLQGSYEAAVVYLDQAILLAPSDDVARLHLGQILRSLGHQERADEVRAGTQGRFSVDRLGSATEQAVGGRADLPEPPDSGRR